MAGGFGQSVINASNEILNQPNLEAVAGLEGLQEASQSFAEKIAELKNSTYSRIETECPEISALSEFGLRMKGHYLAGIEHLTQAVSDANPAKNNFELVAKNLQALWHLNAGSANMILGPISSVIKTIRNRLGQND